MSSKPRGILRARRRRFARVDVLYARRRATDAGALGCDRVERISRAVEARARARSRTLARRAVRRRRVRGRGGCSVTREASRITALHGCDARIDLPRTRAVVNPAIELVVEPAGLLRGVVSVADGAETIGARDVVITLVHVRHLQSRVEVIRRRATRW